LFTVAPDFNKSGAFENTALQNLLSFLVAKHKILKFCIERKKREKNAVSVLFVNKQLQKSRKRLNIDKL
jgi:hypothetical protein